MLRGSPCMCMRQAATPPAATASSAPGLVAIDIINHRRAGPYRRAHHFRLRGIDRNRYIHAGQSFNYWNNAAQFLFHVHRILPGGWTRRQCPANPPPVQSGTRRGGERLPVEAHKPPSEKESGVTLMIPIIRGRREARMPNPDSAVDMSVF